MMQLIYLILYGIFCIWFAQLNADWIEEGKKIKHFWNGLIHLTSASLAFWFFGWEAFISVLIVARLVFDFALNIARDLPLDYVSPNPKSLIDKAEKSLFGKDAFTPKIIYLAILITLICL